MPLSPLLPLLPLRPATASCAAAIGRGSPCQRQAWTEERRRRPVLACLLLWWSVVGGRGESRSTPETCWLMGHRFFANFFCPSLSRSQCTATQHASKRRAEWQSVRASYTHAAASSLI